MQNNTFNEYFAKGQFYEMVNGTKTLVPEKFALGQLGAGSVDVSLVALVTGKRIKVLSLLVANQSGVAGTFSINTKPAGAGVTITPRFSVAANSNFILDPTLLGRFQSSLSQGLSVNTTAASFDILVGYIEISE